MSQLPAVAAASQSLTQPAGSATYITQTLRAGMVQEHAGTVVVFGYAYVLTCAIAAHRQDLRPELHVGTGM